MARKLENRFKQYSWDMLYSVARDRGHTSIENLFKSLSKEIDRSPNYCRRILTDGCMTYEQVCVIADWLEMTPKEFCMVFFNDCFKENPSGRIVFSLGDKK